MMEVYAMMMDTPLKIDLWMALGGRRDWRLRERSGHTNQVLEKNYKKGMKKKKKKKTKKTNAIHALTQK